MPSDLPGLKSLVSDLSVEVLFVSVLLMVLSEYWKRLENFFRNDIIFIISSKWYHFQKIFPPAFFNILTEPLLVTISSNWYHFQNIFPPAFFNNYSDRTIASTETNDTSTERSDTLLFEAGMFKGMALSGRIHAHLPQKDINKKVIWMELSKDWRKIFF